MENYNPCADIKSAHQAIRRSFEAMGIGMPMGLTASQCRIMGFLMDNGDRPIYQKDIEAEFNIRRSTATKLLQAMECKGLIMRLAEENDARLKRISVTAATRQRSLSTIERLSEIERELSYGITEEEKKAFHEICERICENAREQEAKGI